MVHRTNRLENDKKKMILAALMAGSMSLGACATDGMNSQMAGDVRRGALRRRGRWRGRLRGSFRALALSKALAIGAGIGGLAGAVWADNNNDGYADGYYQNPIFSGQPRL